MSMHPKTPGKLLLTITTLALLLTPAAGQAAKIDGDTFTLSWDANDPAEAITGYELHYDLRAGPPYLGTFADQGPSPIDIPVATLEDAQQPSFELSGIPPCSTIFLRMKAYNAEAISDFTEEISGTVAYKPQEVLARPLSSESVQVSWKAPPPGYVDKISRYLVYYDMLPAEVAGPELSYRYMVEVLPSQLQNVAAPSIVIDGLLGDMRVNVAVAATCLGGENDLSEATATQTPKSGEAVPPIDHDLLDGSLAGGCNVATSGGGWAVFLLLALALARRRR